MSSVDLPPEPATLFFNVGGSRNVTITASHKAVSKTAQLVVLPVTK
jgi:hypothetical protein